MSAILTLARIGRNALAAFDRAWERIWFQDSPTPPLEIIRIGVAASLLGNYLLATPYLFTFWGENGWIPYSSLFGDGTDHWMQSLLFYFREPWQLIAFHGIFLFSCAALLVGWRTAWVKWIVTIGQLSYVYRNSMITYGVDQIVCCLLIILCFAPIGKAWSLDRFRAVRETKLGDLNATLPVFTSPWAGACIRLVQIQMAVLFLFSGLNKVRGTEWFDGDAIWMVFVSNEFYNPLLLDVLAPHYWLVNVATYLTLLIELAFPFLIWQRSTRPYLLAAAIFLHVQFGTVMGMPYFSFCMIMGHMSFVRPEWLARLGEWWKRRVGAMEMIYDGKCGFCVRSMAWFLAFDGLRQIGVRNFRTDPSPVVRDELVEKALYLVLPDGRALPGFEAYRHVVLRVPGMWWMVPLFYVPVLSRLLGHPIYNWIASNRSWLSSVTAKAAAPAPTTSA